LTNQDKLFESVVQNLPVLKQNCTRPSNINFKKDIKRLETAEIEVQRALQSFVV